MADSKDTQRWEDAQTAWEQPDETAHSTRPAQGTWTQPDETAHSTAPAQPVWEPDATARSTGGSLAQWALKLKAEQEAAGAKPGMGSTRRAKRDFGDDPYANITGF